MVMNKDALKEILDKQSIKTTEDLTDFLRMITKDVLETLYQGEITAHLGHQKYEKRKDKNNGRNGSSSKTVKSAIGEIDLDVPRDRNGSFEPEIIKKRQTDISGIEAKVISMYAKGMSTRDIKYHIYDIYGYEISPETVSNITDAVIEKAKEWQNRPLKAVYPIVFMDGMIIKLRKDGIVRNYVVYAVLGIDLEGNKECLGIYYSETESAKYWLTVMNELKNRGVQDILIFAVDNLTGISEAIQAAFPKAEIQKCIVHQIRNSLKFVPWKDRKLVASDLKKIYTAPTEEEGLRMLDEFAEKWDKRYPHISKSWYKNWDELSTLFKYTAEVRRLIYTTNPIESFNRGLRKIIKNKAIFPTEDAATKIIYLAIQDMSKRWTQKIKNWGMIFSQLVIFFEDRLEEYL